MGKIEGIPRDDASERIVGCPSYSLVAVITIELFLKCFIVVSLSSLPSNTVF